MDGTLPRNVANELCKLEVPFNAEAHDVLQLKAWSGHQESFIEQSCYDEA